MELRESESELVSLCAGPLRGTAWESSSFSCHLNLHWFSWPELMGTYLPGTGTLAWGPDVELGPHYPNMSLPNFYPPQMGAGPAHSMSPYLCPSLLPVWVDVVSLIL